jgi:hypothetical protein
MQGCEVMKIVVDVTSWLGVAILFMDDRIMWVWPWMRRYNNDSPWYSLELNSSFHSLEALFMMRETSMYTWGYEIGVGEAARRAVNN